MAQQLPVEKWDVERLAMAGVELAKRLRALMLMEEAELARRREYKETRDRALEAIAALRERVAEQQAITTRK